MTDVQKRHTFLNMTNAPQIGQAIRTLRKANGLTLEMVARIADTAPAYLSKVESGALTPSADYAARVVSAIGTEMARRVAGRGPVAA